MIPEKVKCEMLQAQARLIGHILDLADGVTSVGGLACKVVRASVSRADWENWNLDECQFGIAVDPRVASAWAGGAKILTPNGDLLIDVSDEVPVGTVRLAALCEVERDLPTEKR